MANCHEGFFLHQGKILLSYITLAFCGLPGNFFGLHVENYQQQISYANATYAVNSRPFICLVEVSEVIVQYIRALKGRDHI